MSVELSEALLSKAAGWDAMKRARAYLAQGQVLSSYWAAPLLRGVVQSGETSFRASMVIKNEIDLENLCTCRDAREWGKICPHVVAVGLHWLRNRTEASEPTAPGESSRVASVQPPRRNAGGAVSAGFSALKRDPLGQPAELFIIFPPNLEQALARGKVMLVIEAKWVGGRSPLNALPKHQAYAFSPADTLLIDRLESLAEGETPGMLQLGIKDFAGLLNVMVGHSNLSLGKATGLTVARAGFRLKLGATLEPGGEITVALREKLSSVTMVEGWIFSNNTLQPLGLPPDLQEVLHGPVRVPRTQVPQFLSQVWPRLQAGAETDANFSVDDFTMEPQVPRIHLELRGGLAQLAALLQCAYGSRILTLGVTAPDESLWLPDPENPTRYSTRNFEVERAALARLQRGGFTGPDGQGKLQLLGQEAVLNFFAREFPKLQREWEVTLEERLERSTTQNIERIEPQFRVTPSGVEWFELGVVFGSGSGQTFSPAEVQRLLLSGRNHTRLQNGKLALIDIDAVEEFSEVLRDCEPQQQGQGYRIHHTQAGFLESTLRQHAGWRLEAPKAWRERAAAQSGEAKLICPPLGDLKSVLRPYQKQGVAWLQFLRDNSFGGILADEMGLGKTLQTLAFLRHRRIDPPAYPQERILPHLVVCPTSLVFNWLAEARRFTPTLKVVALQGPERHDLFSGVPQADLVLTSYALLRRDADRYREFEFDTLVLDEAQHIKNRETQNAQAVKSLKARHRLVLTGTPLENSVLDLWSIFDFLMPGYLGSAKDFRERYELPITREQNAAAQSRLARRLRPFMLRRLKKEVAADLPAKLEQVAFCELTADQRAAYQQLIEASRKEILENVGAQGIAKSRMLVLTTLLRLRQVCCDLRLVKPDATDPATASGKLDLFEELLEEVMDGGHRVLVFSQFVSMLSLLKERLTAEGVEYCYLDGSTADRGAVIARFQNTSAIPVFLISLKAGGTGLNLTGADTVIHFDPWWNPAVEEQATARSHRIGQTKVVTSYKLITRDTVEEKILTLQNRKRAVIEATIGGEEQFTAGLSWEEIQELLA